MAYTLQPMDGPAVLAALQLTTVQPKTLIDMDNEEFTWRYKKLALKAHPDKNPGDPTAVQRFQDLKRAVELFQNMDEAQRRKLATHLAEQTGEWERTLHSKMEAEYRTMPGVAVMQAEVMNCLYQRARLA